MGAYILRRLLLMIPTVFGIMAISFLITQFAPGGPVEQALANLSGQNQSIAERITGSEAGDFAGQPGPQGGRSRPIAAARACRPTWSRASKSSSASTSRRSSASA